jgi:hypothetical protein
MPVQKFRRIEDMKAPWIAPDDPRLADRLRSWWGMCARLFPHRAMPRGVRKYRTIEEANRDREQWSREGAAQPPKESP